MAKALTAIAIGNLKPRPQRYEVSDPGCAGLRVVVFPSKKKSFVVRYRFRGLQRKLTLGSCLVGADQGEPTDSPELSTPLSLVAARELATKALRQARAGADPCAAKQRARAEELAAESDTLGAIAGEYLRREGPRLRTVGQRKSDLDLLCASVLGRQPVAGITRGQYTRVLDHIADNNGPVRADRVLSALRTLLSWHSARSDFISPLVRGGRRTSIAERARSRVLSDDELRRLWLAAEQDKGPFGPFVRFTLLTSTRRGEAAALKYAGIVGRRHGLDHSGLPLQVRQGRCDSVERGGAGDHCGAAGARRLRLHHQRIPAARRLRRPQGRLGQDRRSRRLCFTRLA